MNQLEIDRKIKKIEWATRIKLCIVVVLIVWSILTRGLGDSSQLVLVLWGYWWVHRERRRLEDLV